MTDLSPARARDRSPPFPYISLPRAVDRLQQFYDKAKRHEVFMMDAAPDWGFQPKSSSVFQTVGALLGFGLIEDSGSGDQRKIRVSELGWKLLEDRRPGVRDRLMSEAALKPRLMGELFSEWGYERPDDTHARSQLKVEKGFTDEAAGKVLRVYDETVVCMTPPSGEKLSEADRPKSDGTSVPATGRDLVAGAIYGQGELATMSMQDVVAALSQVGTSPLNEREWGRGPLSKASGYRLMVSGEFGTREIIKLIKLLEAQRAVLEDDD